MILVKIHETFQGGLKKTVLAASDSDLIGKTIKENNIELCVSEKFYKGKEVNEEKFLVFLENCDSANLVGKETIALALKHKIIKPEEVIKINGTPHAQIF
ncbi:MAG: DUF424 family protein [Candidatus Nanoarchaeia archaeon]|nr:DUF424 family protein [Candidatus Nanoarchaeia archaeon]